MAAVDGPPIDMVVTSDKVKETGELSIKMVPVSLSTSDWMMLVAVIALQVALVVFLWCPGARSLPVVRKP